MKKYSRKKQKNPHHNDHVRHHAHKVMAWLGGLGLGFVFVGLALIGVGLNQWAIGPFVCCAFLFIFVIIIGCNPHFAQY